MNRKGHLYPFEEKWQAPSVVACLDCVGKYLCIVTVPTRGVNTGGYVIYFFICNKGANKEIDRTHKRALRILFKDYESSFETLLARSSSNSIHIKNLQKLMTEIYKSMNHLNPSIVWEFHEKKPIKYNLRIQNLCKLPTIKTLGFGLNSLSFRGSFLWNTLDDSIKQVPTLSCFKKRIKDWTADRCTCKICR